MAPSLSWIERSSIQELAARVHGRPSTLPPTPAPSSARVRFGVGGAVDVATAAPRAAEPAPLPASMPPRLAPLPPPPPPLVPPSPLAPPASSVPPMPVVPAPVRASPAASPAPALSTPPAPRPVPLRSAKDPATTSSASWQRPSFQSVEIDAGALGLDLDALRRAMPPSSGPPSSPPARALTVPPPPVAPSTTAAPASAPREQVPTPRLVRAPAAEPVAAPPPDLARPAVSAPAATERYDDEEGELVPLSGGQVSPSISLSSVLQGTFAQKLEVFVHWLMGSTGAFAAFVVDDQGLEVANRHATEDLLAVSALIDRRLAEARGVLAGHERDGSFSLELDEQNVLHVIWADVAGSRFGIGLVVRDALEGKLTQAIRRSFRAVAATNEAQPRSA